SEKGIIGTPEERARLVEAYAGNPLALKVVAETISDLFAGAIGPFLKQSVVIFGSIEELLAEQVARLSTVEQTVLRSLAIAREPLIDHGLSQARASEDVRQMQERLIVAPILARLRSVYPGRAEVEEHLLALFAQLRERADAAQGYGPANLVALLRQQRGHLRG